MTYLMTPLFCKCSRLQPVSTEQIGMAIYSAEQLKAEGAKGRSFKIQKMNSKQPNHPLSEYQKKELDKIDREIQEYLSYLERLHKKNGHPSHLSKLAKKNRKKGKVNNSNSLTRFSQSKLKEFEKRKEFILRQRQVVEEIDWECVRFEDHFIRVSAHGYLSEPFSVPESRKSLEFLKNYIKRSSLTPLRISLFGNKIVSIENADELSKIIEILSLQNEINDYFEDTQSSAFEKIYTKLGKISNKYLVDLFKMREKGSYINYLCQVQNPNYKIVPTTENIGTGHGLTSWEETFLFTATKSKVPYVIL